MHCMVKMRVTLIAVRGVVVGEQTVAGVLLSFTLKFWALRKNPTTSQ